MEQSATLTEKTNKQTQLLLVRKAETLPPTDYCEMKSFYITVSEVNKKALLWSFRFIIMCRIPVHDPCEHLLERTIPSAWLCFIHECLSLLH